MGVADAAEDLPVEADEGDGGDDAGHHQPRPVDVEPGERLEAAGVGVDVYPNKYKFITLKKKRKKYNLCWRR